MTSAVPFCLLVTLTDGTSVIADMVHGCSLINYGQTPQQVELNSFNPLKPTVAIWVQRQSARMSKITNDGLTRSGTGCFIAVPIWQQ